MLGNDLKALLFQTAQEDAILLATMLEYGQMLATLQPLATSASQEKQAGLSDRMLQCSEAIKILRRRNT